jgi:SAM-dependent methyltransferase
MTPMSHLTLEEYAELCWKGNPGLPKMPPREIQRRWTWYEGSAAMKQSIAHMNGIKEAYVSLTNRAFEDATVLDYGAGWGRLTRLALHFIPAERVFACDADPKSVALFNSLAFPMHCTHVPVLPKRLPYEGDTFDLVWLWSVLTHLPERNADFVMRALLPVIKADGLLLITIRPPSFWTSNPITKASHLESVHNERGFAHDSKSEHWGDTSMSLEYIQRTWPQWSILDTRDDESHQVQVYLRPS